MKKYFLILFGIIAFVLIYTNIYKVYAFFSTTKKHTISVYNKSGIPVDSIMVRTCFNCKNISLPNGNLKIKEVKKFSIDLSDYKPPQKDGFFFIKVYQGDYYIQSAFNYHDGWGIPKESDIYVYKDFIALARMKNPKPIDDIPRKGQIEK
jgi:hypothetical protein